MESVSPNIVENGTSNFGQDNVSVNAEKENEVSPAVPTPLSEAIRNAGSKSPEKCPICLSIPEDRSYTDSCYHEFCFVCLLEWSKVKSECPLCKQKFKNIIHNIRSIDDYDKYAIPTETESFGIDNAGQRFRFPTTMTVERVELLRLIRQLHLQMQEMQRNNQILQRNRQMYLRQLARIQRLRHLFERSAERRERLTATSDFRRVVYERRLRAIPPALGERTRQSGPDFYMRNPACLHRLMPWLNRELNVLMFGEPGRVEFLMNLIRSMLTRWPIDSQETRNLLTPYIGQYTDAFIHEFYNFARSPYDMEDYDRHVQYESWHQARARLRRPDEAPPEIVIGSSPSPERGAPDDDIMLESAGTSAPFRNPSPPQLHPWSMMQARLDILNRYEQIIQRSLGLLDTGRRIQHARHRRTTNLARASVARERDWNTTVDVLSSSTSDDDDSPRLDPNARTPPYLLKSRKRSSYTRPSAANETKRRRFPGSSTSLPPSTSAAAGNSSILLIEEEDDNAAGTSRGLENDNGSILPFSPAPAYVETLDDSEADADTNATQFGSFWRGSDRSTISSVPTYLYGSTRSGSDSTTPIYDSRDGSLSRSSNGWSQLGQRQRSSSPSSGTEINSFGTRTLTSTLHEERSPRGDAWRDYWRSRDTQRRRTSTSSSSSIDPDDVQVVAELKPKRLRTPELVTVDDEEDNEVDRKPSKSNLAAIADDMPTTSGIRRSRERSVSVERKHRSHKKHKHRHRDHHHHRHHRGHKKSKKEKKSKRRHREEKHDSSSSPPRYEEETKNYRRSRSL